MMLYILLYLAIGFTLIGFVDAIRKDSTNSLTDEYFWGTLLLWPVLILINIGYKLGELFK